MSVGRFLSCQWWVIPERIAATSDKQRQRGKEEDETYSGSKGIRSFGHDDE